MMYVCLQLGLVVGSSAALKLKVPVRSEGDDVSKSTTKEDRAEVQKARAAAKNTFEFVTRLLADWNLWARNVIISEVAMAVEANAPAIGINNRDLHTFSEDLGTTERVRRLIPPEIPVVAASGVRSFQGMKRMREAGVDAVLVGEALSTAADPVAKFRELQGRETA